MSQCTFVPLFPPCKHFHFLSTSCQRPSPIWCSPAKKEIRECLCCREECKYDPVHHPFDLVNKRMKVAMNLDLTSSKTACSIFSPLQWGQYLQSLFTSLQVLKLFPEHLSPSYITAPLGFMCIFTVTAVEGTAKCLGALSFQGSFCQPCYRTATPSESHCQHGSLSQMLLPAKLLNTNQDLVWTGLDQPKTSFIEMTITKQKKNKLHRYKF